MQYFITSMTSGKIDRNYKSRCFGYFSSKNRALEAIENNECDLHECLYDLIVLEELNEGIHPAIYKDIDNRNDLWFKWNNNKWEKIECPPEFKNVYGFALG